MTELEKEIHRMEGHRKYPLPKPPRKQIKDDLQPTGILLNPASRGFLRASV
jgi:hypothetical protein